MSKKEEEQLSQREWDRVVGIGKTQPPAKSKEKDDPWAEGGEVIPLSPFTNHKPTYDRMQEILAKNKKND